MLSRLSSLPAHMIRTQHYGSSTLGRFWWPELAGAAKVDMEPAALTMLLAGIDLQDGGKKAWYER